jgi:hypothetical protein
MGPKSQDVHFLENVSYAIECMWRSWRKIILRQVTLRLRTWDPYAKCQ